MSERDCYIVISANLKKQKSQQFYQQNEFLGDSRVTPVQDQQTMVNRRQVGRAEERGGFCGEKGELGGAVSRVLSGWAVARQREILPPARLPKWASP